MSIMERGVCGGVKRGTSSSGSLRFDDVGVVGERGKVGVDLEDENPQILRERLMFLRSSIGAVAAV